MKRAIITILGLIKVPQNGLAKYSFAPELNCFSLKKSNYVNMLPLLIDNFSKNYEIRCIYTNASLKAQQEVLKYENLSFDIQKNGSFVSENVLDENGFEIEASKYSYFLKIFNEEIEKYDEVIIDVSHGFRHFPILATINMIIQNIKNPKKIKYIFFAKEIVKNQKYEIIDLREYLSLANLSFLLSSFNNNYTVSTNINFINPLYQEIANKLEEFSHYFLSNSLKVLYEKNLIETLINDLQTLQMQKETIHFNFYINNIITHLQKIQSLKNLSTWQRLFELSKIMNQRGYQLNSLTLLFEATGFYCLEKLKNLPKTGNLIKEFEEKIKNKKTPKHIYSSYTMTNQARNIVKLQEKFKLFDYFINEESKNEIINYLQTINSNKLKKFVNFLYQLEYLRNNLAHGNSSTTIIDIEKKLKTYQKEFFYFTLKHDILQIS